MQPFLALITPIGGEGLGTWGGAPLPWPEHPIAPGGPPPGIWPSPGYPAHPIAPGGPPPSIWPTPPGGYFPSHPIVLPPYQPGGPPVTVWPPGFWGGAPHSLA